MSTTAIIICKNAQDFISDCLRSIYEQSNLINEILVVDGHSTDATLQILSQYPDIQVLIQNKSGIGNARNIGILHSSSEFIAFLDSDDTWEPNKLGLQLKALSENTDLEAIGGYLRKNEANESVMAMTPGGFLFRKNVFDRYGLFDEYLEIAMDHEWFIRAIRGGLRYEVLAQNVLNKKIHGNNLSIIKQKKYRQEMMFLLRKYQ